MSTTGPPGPEGEFFREGNTFIARRLGYPDLLNEEGVEVENRWAPESEWIYRKVFSNKEFYTADQYEKAIRDHLVGTYVIVLGMNGYSVLSPEKCRAWGVAYRAYGAACKRMMVSTGRAMMQEFAGVDPRIVHGASDMEVDRAAIGAAKILKRNQLGFSCPKFVFYVKDGDGVPVFVARTQDEYSLAFIRSLDILIAANGRMQAFQHDIDAAFKYLKHVIPVNVLKTLSTTGGPPAINEKGEIEDAVAAFEQRVHLIATRYGYGRSDAYKEMLNYLNETVVGISRKLLSPELAFGEEEEEEKQPEAIVQEAAVVTTGQPVE